MKVKRFQRPVDPPSVFPNCPESWIPKTFAGELQLGYNKLYFVNGKLNCHCHISAKSRKVEERNVSLVQRGARPDEMDAFNALDMIPSWDEFCTSLPVKDFIASQQLLIQRRLTSIAIFNIVDTAIDYSVVVEQSLSVCANRRHTCVPIRDLLGFQQKLTRYSQLEAILLRVRNATCALSAEVRFVIEELRGISAASGNSYESKLEFALRQLELGLQAPKGCRYSAKDVILATKLFLVSRQCYKVSRSLLTLPHPDTLKRYLGGLGSVDTYNDCRAIVETNFKGLTGIDFMTETFSCFC